MSDNEIIKALECCKTITVFDCDMCPYKGIGKGLAGCANLLIGDALDLINRQMAEIDRLNAELQKEREDNYNLVRNLQSMGAEVERLREVSKEMTEEQKDCPFCAHFVGCEAARGGRICSQFEPKEKDGNSNATE